MTTGHGYAQQPSALQFRNVAETASTSGKQPTLVSSHPPPADRFEHFYRIDVPKAAHGQPSTKRGRMILRTPETKKPPKGGFQTADEPPIFRGFCFSDWKSADFLDSSQKGLNSETFVKLAD
jgi:hypothetical protein